MSVKGTFSCDLDCCDHHAGAWDGHMGLPAGFIEVREDNARLAMHFCGWDCLMKFAAQIEPPTIIDA